MSWEARIRAAMLGNVIFMAMFFIFSTDNPINDVFWANIIAISYLFQIPLDFVGAGTINSLEKSFADHPSQ
ncbi:MAG: hypothetical protein Fur005_37180 [Roseiflexaceae bacterium]